MILPKIKRGFTLIEILLVIAILAILLVVVFAALNPAQRLADTRDARRWNDVNQVLTAVHECLVDEDGVWATCGLADPTALSQLGTCSGTGATLCSGAAADCLDITTELASYISDIPEDPADGSGDGVNTSYAIQVANGIVTVSSCSAPGDTNGATIEVSR
jgi:prepilin-type N-terminal cleavage/methylation domain-containing protein